MTQPFTAPRRQPTRRCEMTGSRRVLVYAIFVCLGLADRAWPQARPVLPPRDVAVLALGDEENSGDAALLRLAIQIFGDRQMPTTLRDVQFDVIRKTASFGPVLLLVPNDAAKSNISGNCAVYELCEALAAGQLRLAVVRHDTPWVRDYGPLVEPQGSASVRVVDARYYDVRQDDERASMLKNITEERLRLVTRALNPGESSGDPLDRLLARESDDEGLQKRLSLLSQLAELLRDDSLNLQRRHDDGAAFDIAAAGLMRPEFEYVNTPMFVDGGNLLKLDDGTCLTTKALFGRNPGQQKE